MLTLRSAPAGPGDEALVEAKREISARLAALNSELARLAEVMKGAEKEVADKTKERDDAKSQREGLAADASETDRNAADRKLSNAERALQKASNAQKSILRRASWPMDTGIISTKSIRKSMRIWASDSSSSNGDCTRVAREWPRLI